MILTTPPTARTIDPVHGANTHCSRADHKASYRSSWSSARVSAAVTATRTGRASVDQPQSDEIEFFAATGTRHDVPCGVALVRRGAPMGEVHLVRRGAVAVVGKQGHRRPILAFAVRSEFCCAIPALLHEPAPWDALTVMSTSVLTVPTARFTAAVRDRWVDRWSTRTLSWLAEVGARVADLDERNLTGQAAALLLRHRGELSLDLCSRTIADLLDVEDEAIRHVLADLEQLGAVRLVDGRVSVAQREILRSTAASARRSARGSMDRSTRLRGSK